METNDNSVNEEDDDDENWESVVSDTQSSVSERSTVDLMSLTLEEVIVHVCNIN